MFMTDLVTIARPYAKAAFDFSVENEKLSQWSEMFALLSQVLSNEEYIELSRVLATSEQQVESLISICGEHLDLHAHNLLRIMAQGNRLNVLPNVCDEFFLLKQKYDQCIDIEVTSAFDLTPEQKESLSQKLKRRFNQQMNLSYAIDKSLLGGIVIRTGDLMIDDSVRGRLERMNDTLKF